MQTVSHLVWTQKLLSRDSSKMCIVFNNYLEKERRGKSCCLYIYNHAVQISEEILGVIFAFVLFFPSLSCLLVNFFSCSFLLLLLLFFYLCLHDLVNRTLLNKTSTCQYVAETIKLKITNILITNSNYLLIFA